MRMLAYAHDKRGADGFHLITSVFSCPFCWEPEVDHGFHKPRYAMLCIPWAGFGFSGDAFLHLGEVPSVQVSPHHWRVSDSHRQHSILGTPISMTPQRYIGFSGDTQ